MGLYFEKGYGGPWDVAAGLLIVREAGGVVRTVDDGPFELLAGKGEVLCGNAAVCSAIAKVIAEP
jgi:inositol-phosphate phosphatase/L-galactose 1-phosphate phosphatase